MRFWAGVPGLLEVKAITQPWEAALSGRDSLAVAKLIDSLGFYGVSVSEHFLTASSQVDLTGNRWFDGSTAQAAIAGATERVVINTLLTILPLHHPVEMAKSLATVDWFSGGRAAVTFGVGWQAEEYAAMNVDFATRGRRADECLEAIFELWHAEDPEFHGEFFDFAEVKFGPKPLQSPHPPVWMGGDADRVLRRAARFADGWAPWLTAPEDIPKKLDLVFSDSAYDGREFSVFCSLGARNVGEGHEVVDAHRASRNLDAVLSELGMLAELGVTDTSVPVPPCRDRAEYEEHLAWVAEEVIPAA